MRLWERGLALEPLVLWGIYQGQTGWPRGWSFRMSGGVGRHGLECVEVCLEILKIWLQIL